MQSSLASRHFPSLRSKYSPQHPFLVWKPRIAATQIVTFTWWESSVNPVIQKIT